MPSFVYIRRRGLMTIYWSGGKMEGLLILFIWCITRWLSISSSARIWRYQKWLN